MKTISFLHNIVRDKDQDITFFRLIKWDKTELDLKLLNDVYICPSKIKRFRAWLRDLRKKEKGVINFLTYRPNSEVVWENNETIS